MMNVTVRFKSGEEEEIDNVSFVPGPKNWGDRGLLFVGRDLFAHFYNLDSVESVITVPHRSVEKNHAENPA